MIRYDTRCGAFSCMVTYDGLDGDRPGNVTYVRGDSSHDRGKNEEANAMQGYTCRRGPSVNSTSTTTARCSGGRDFSRAVDHTVRVMSDDLDWTAEPCMLGLASYHLGKVTMHAMTASHGRPETS